MCMGNTRFECLVIGLIGGIIGFILAIVCVGLN